LITAAAHSDAYPEFPLALSEDVIPDETTVLRFRHLLEEHRLTEAMFEAVRYELLPAGATCRL
jgi:transposase, IS5 family